jgi:general secretion pathway protein F
VSVYAYTGRDASGRRQRGWIEAETPKSARIMLEGRGILTEHLTDARMPGHLGIDGRARVYRELGVLMRAGFTLERALGMLLDERQTDLRLRGFLAGLRDRIRDGLPLSRAMLVAATRLPPYERAALLAAEQTGLHGAMLEQLADFIEAQLAVTARLRAALLYPAAVLLLATALLSLMMFVVLPRATRIFVQFGDGLPAATERVALWGPRLMLLLLLTTCGAVVAGVWLRQAARNDERLAMRAERGLLRLPIIRTILPRLWSLRFASTMSLLVQAGVPPQEALAVAGSATGSLWMTTLTLEQTSTVRQGGSLSSAIGSLPPLAPHLAEWVRVGESAGNLQEMLDQAAARCRQGYEIRLSRLLGLLEPALILAVGLAVLFIAYTVLKPMLDLARTVSGG